MSESADRIDEVEAALAALDQLGDAPLAAHAEAFERAHEVLQQRLGEADR